MCPNVYEDVNIECDFTHAPDEDVVDTHDRLESLESTEELRHVDFILTIEIDGENVTSRHESNRGALCYGWFCFRDFLKLGRERTTWDEKSICGGERFDLVTTRRDDVLDLHVLHSDGTSSDEFTVSFEDFYLAVLSASQCYLKAVVKINPDLRDHPDVLELEDVIAEASDWYDEEYGDEPTG